VTNYSPQNTGTTAPSDPTPPKCRREWMSRTATALCFALAVAVSTTSAPTVVFAETPAAVAAERSPALGIVLDMQSTLAALGQEVRVDLDARVNAQTDAILQQVVDQEIAALLEQRQQNLARRHKTPNSVGPQMQTITVRADREPAIDEAEDRSIELARRSLEIGQ